MTGKKMTSATQKSGQSGDSTVKRDPLKPRTKKRVTGLFWEVRPQTLYKGLKTAELQKGWIIYEVL